MAGYDKQIKIYPGVDSHEAISVLRDYLKHCEIEPRKNGYAGCILYAMHSGAELLVYQTKTSYVIRLNQ